MGCGLISFVILVVIIVLIVVVSQDDVDEKSMSSTFGPKKGNFPLSLSCEVIKSGLKNKKISGKRAKSKGKGIGRGTFEETRG